MKITHLNQFITGIACLTFGLYGCGQDRDICEIARAHLQVCLGSSAALPEAVCVPDDAKEIANRSCDDLMVARENVKADGLVLSLDNLLCDLGVIRKCPIPECPSGKNPGWVQSCPESLDFSGCAACQFYPCREDRSAQACGELGYYLGYGYKYCLRFTQATSPRMSAEGQQWIEDVKECLIRSIIENVGEEENCETIKQIAFEAHPDCYVDAGFCFLPVADWWLVLNTVDLADMDLKEMLITQIYCLREYLEKAGEVFP